MFIPETGPGAIERSRERWTTLEVMTSNEFTLQDNGTILTIMSDGDIITARQQGRSLVMRLGFSSPEAMLVATAISELARNIVQYAERGEIVLRSLERDGRPGILVIARDQGPGIPEIQQAALNGAGTSGTRLGLRGMKRLVDECEIVSAAGKGTIVAITKWKA
jgi:serine/threonine-protein kinase RsbT